MTHVDRDEERWALVRWSALAEPGGLAAGALVDAFGAAGAFRWLRQASQDMEGATARLPRTWDARLARAVVTSHEAWWSRRDLATGVHEDRARAVGARVVTRLDAEYPPAMRDLGLTAPFAVYVRGERRLDELYERSVAIVGARAATSYGAHIAGECAAAFAARGWTVVSGGAYGIDARAHSAALRAGAPTAAVMAGGVDRLYPAGHEDLLRGVIAAGAVCAEVPPGFAPYRQRFLSRNRLIAVARATIVVEAAARSGALSTARHAAELFRPVGAYPGPVTSASSAGCHRLVRDGQAVLVTHPDEAWELAAGASEFAEAADDEHREQASAERGPASATLTATAPQFRSPHERAVYDALTRSVRSVDDVAQRAGLGVREASAALAGLEVSGLARPVRHGWARAA